MESMSSCKLGLCVVLCCGCELTVWLSVSLVQHYQIDDIIAP